MTRIGVSNAEADAFADITQRLRRYRSMVANYQACKELYDSLFPSCTQVLTDMPKTQADTYETERWAGKRFDLSARMQQALAEMEQEISKLLTMMQSIEPGESAILIRQYILGETMDTVSKNVNYSIRVCWRMHNRAIEKLAKQRRENE
jgi:DNA-directed RNA polymerase specialized sigma24 family protein